MLNQLEIISYNIEVGKKLDDVVSWITQADLHPDVFCFQEFPEKRLAYFEAFLQMRGYQYVYTPGVIIGKSQVGELTAYKKSKLQLVEHKELPLGNYFLERRYKKLRGQRSALLTSYKYRDSIFAVANIHLSVFSPHSMRYKQLSLVLESLGQLAEKSLVIGDFNYTSLFGVKKLFAFMETYGFSCAGERMITHKIFRRIPQQLDYVFHKNLFPNEVTVHKVPHSDHLPVSVLLKVKSAV